MSFRDCGIEDIALGVGSVSDLINKEVVEEVKRIDPAPVSLPCASILIHFVQKELFVYNMSSGSQQHHSLLFPLASLAGISKHACALQRNGKSGRRRQR